MYCLYSKGETNKQLFLFEVSYLGDESREEHLGRGNSINNIAWVVEGINTLFLRKSERAVALGVMLRTIVQF